MRTMHYSHDLSLTRLEQIVGVFVLIPLLVLGAVLFVITRGEGLFAMKYEIRTNLSQAYGIQPGTAVFIRGLQVGEVKQLLFDNQGGVEVRLQILKKFREQVRQDSFIVVSRGTTALGETSMIIEGGTTIVPEVPPEGTIVATEPEGQKDLLTGIKPLVAEATMALDQIQAVRNDLKTINETLGSLRDMLSHLTDTAEKLPVVLDDMTQVVSLAYQVVQEMPHIATTARDVVNDMDDVAEKMKITVHALPPIVTTVHGVVSDIRAATEGLENFDHNILYGDYSVGRPHDDVGISGQRSSAFPMDVIVGHEQSASRWKGVRSLRIDQLQQSTGTAEAASDLSSSYD